MSFANPTVTRIYRFRVYTLSVTFFVVLIGTALVSVFRGRDLRRELRGALAPLLPKNHDPSRALMLVDRVLDDAEALGIEKDRMVELADEFLASLRDGFDADLAVGLLHRLNETIYGNAFLREDLEEFEEMMYRVGPDGRVRTYEVNQAVERAFRILDTVEIVRSPDGQGESR